jgi:hypothetical protein
MAGLGTELWKHPHHHKTAAIRLVALKYPASCDERFSLALKRELGRLPLLTGRDRLSYPREIY